MGRVEEGSDRRRRPGRGHRLGGLSTEQARASSSRELVKPLDKPVTVTFEGTKYVLSPDKLELRADIDGMVDDALDASR